MKIVRDRPPNFEAIDQAFKIRGMPVVFAYGDRIYAPSGNAELPEQIVAHERVHGQRQLNYNPPGATRLALMPEEKIELWWKRYIADIDFRREEERLAHLAEYLHLCARAGGRNQRRRHLSIVASKLSHPLYGPLMNKERARKVLEDGDYPHS